MLTECEYQDRIGLPPPRYACWDRSDRMLRAVSNSSWLRCYCTRGHSQLGPVTKLTQTGLAQFPWLLRTRRALGACNKHHPVVCCCHGLVTLRVVLLFISYYCRTSLTPSIPIIPCRRKTLCLLEPVVATRPGITGQADPKLLH